GDERLREAVRSVGDSVRGAAAAFDRARRGASRPAREAPLLARRHLVDVHGCDAGRELRDPDDEVALRGVEVERDRRRAVDRSLRGDDAEAAAGVVAGLDLRAEARRVGRDPDPVRLRGVTWVEDEPDAGFGERAVVLGVPVRRLVLVRRPWRGLAVLFAVAVGIP